MDYLLESFATLYYCHNIIHINVLFRLINVFRQIIVFVFFTDSNINYFLLTVPLLSVAVDFPRYGIPDALSSGKRSLVVVTQTMRHQSQRLSSGVATRVLGYV